MTQCVPSWDLEDNSMAHKAPFHPNSNINDAKAPDVVDPTLDYEVAELTWENGQLALHGLGPPRAASGKPASSKYRWEKPQASGTLESIVDQAAQLAPCEGQVYSDDLVPWFDPSLPPPRAAGGRTMAMDALVPSSSSIQFSHDQKHPNLGDTCATGKSTRVGSCGGAASCERGKEVEGRTVRKRARAPPQPAREGCSRNQSVSVSDMHVGAADSCEMEQDMAFTSTSLASDTNPNTLDDRDSVSHSRPQKKQARSKEGKNATISTKRIRAAAIHNQSERKRRDKINQRMKTLQKLVPNSSKTDKASMLDEVIEYLKTLQAQVQMMNRMSMPPMMMPMAAMQQQQLQMAMMAQMGMGMGMGMGVMDMGRPNIAGMPQVLNPAAFMPMPSWDGANDRLPASTHVMPDMMAGFLACQPQPMTVDVYSKMAALYQQLHQQQVSNSKP